MDATKNIELVSMALDASLMRQTAIANNIANINTPDYRTMEVNFEQQLNQTDSMNVKPVYQQAEQQSSIDEQMAFNVQNMTHYRALIKGLNQELAIMKLALQGSNQ